MQARIKCPGLSGMDHDGHVADQNAQGEKCNEHHQGNRDEWSSSCFHDDYAGQPHVQPGWRIGLEGLSGAERGGCSSRKSIGPVSS